MFVEVPVATTRRQPKQQRSRETWRLAVASKLASRRDLDRVSFMVAQMAQALAHAVVSRPAKLSLAAAKADAVLALMAYLRA